MQLKFSIELIKILIGSIESLDILIEILNILTKLFCGFDELVDLTK